MSKSDQTVPWQDRMSMWQVDKDWDPVPEQTIDDLVMDGPDEWGISFDTLISKSPAYEWLLARMHRELMLQPAKPDLLADIRAEITKSISTSSVVSRNRPSQEVKASFVADWDPIAFILEQGYSGEPHEEIGKVVTLTGYINDAQATTCADYLNQTWPSVGLHVLRLINQVMRSSPDHEARCK
jgi:hypothetical protein